MKVFSREKDSFAFSEFLHKPQGEKLQLGPAWDFDRSAASEGSHNANLSAEGWAHNEHEYRPFQYGWWNRLFADPNFKQKWMDRWQELRETVYSDANLVAVVHGHAEEIDEAHPRNTSRWPDAAPNGGAYADPGTVGFAAEVSHLTNWLLARAAWIDDQMAARPAIVLAAGESPDEVRVTLSHGGGVLYYTLDGSDPRASGGGIKAGALVYAGPFNVAVGVKINARAYDVTAPLGPWSGMETDTPQAVGDPNALRIVELMYNPPGSADDTEYFELLNTGTATIQLAGFQITEFSSGGFTFSGGSLAPGERIVVVKNQAAFAAAYPNVTNVAAGEFSGSLSNEGELVALLNPLGQTLQAFNYGDSNVVGWPELPDGEGWSLEYIGPLTAGENPLDGAPNDPFDDPANWRASVQEGGSPGTDGEPNTPVVSGDFNGDGIVSGADFLAWQRGFGSANAQKQNGDANNDHIVDVQDLNVWKNQYGGPPPHAVAAVTVGVQTGTDAALPAFPAVVAPVVAPQVAATTEPPRRQAGNYWIETLALASPFRRPAAPSPAVERPNAESTDVAFAGFGDEPVTRRASALDLIVMEWPAEEEAASVDEFGGLNASEIAALLAASGK